METKGGIGIGIALTIVAFLVGLYGIAILIGVGESTNNGITAFVAVSFPFALVAGIFSWFSPKFRWAIAIAISAPVAILGLIGSWSGGYMLPGAIWTVALACGAAYLGARMRMAKSTIKQSPPS